MPKSCEESKQMPTHRKPPAALKRKRNDRHLLDPSYIPSLRIDEHPLSYVINLERHLPLNYKFCVGGHDIGGEGSAM